MKRNLFMVVIALMVFGLGSVAYAAPFMLPGGEPIYIKFDNVEQLSLTNSIVAPSGANESNWGVFKVSSISLGDTSTQPQNFPPTTQIWTDSMPGEITGIFAGFTAVGGGPTFDSTNGSLYLYWDDVENANLATATPGQRTGDFAFTNFTDGTLLAKIDFVNGAIKAGASVTGTAVPTSGGFTGIANSFGNVDLSAGGLWSTILDGNYFDTLLGNNTADFKFRTIYENDGGHSWDDLLSGIFGADSSDPARAHTVPEPSSILLLGAGLLGLAGLGYRSRRK